MLQDKGQNYLSKLVKCFYVVMVLLCSNGISAHGGIHESIKRISKEIELYPDSCNLYIIRGQYYMIDEDYDSAYYDYMKAEEIDSTEIVVDLLLAKLFNKKSFYQDAMIHINKYLRVQAESVDGLITRAALYEQMDSITLAQKDLEKAIDLLKYPEPVHFILMIDAVYNNDSSNFKEAVEWFEKGYEELGFNIVMKEKEIELALNAKKYEHAEEVIIEIIDQFKRKEKWLYRLGELHEKQNHNAKALYFYQQTIEAINLLNPKHQNIRKIKELRQMAEERIAMLSTK